MKKYIIVLGGLGTLSDLYDQLGHPEAIVTEDSIETADTLYKAHITSGSLRGVMADHYLVMEGTTPSLDLVTAAKLAVKLKKASK